MAENNNNHDASEGRASGLDQAFGVLDKVFGRTSAVLWKAAVFYALWIGGAYAAMTNASQEATIQLSAIAYWFGWLFLAMTAALGLFVLVTGSLDRRRANGRRNNP